MGQGAALTRCQIHPTLTLGFQAPGLWEMDLCGLRATPSVVSCHSSWDTRTSRAVELATSSTLGGLLSLQGRGCWNRHILGGRTTVRGKVSIRASRQRQWA